VTSPVGGFLGSTREKITGQPTTGGWSPNPAEITYPRGPLAPMCGTDVRGVVAGGTWLPG
jgi:hypothetical protein